MVRARAASASEREVPALPLGTTHPTTTDRAVQACSSGTQWRGGCFNCSSHALRLTGLHKGVPVSGAAHGGPCSPSASGVARSRRLRRYEGSHRGLLSSNAPAAGPAPDRRRGCTALDDRVHSTVRPCRRHVRFRKPWSGAQHRRVGWPQCRRRHAHHHCRLWRSKAGCYRLRNPAVPRNLRARMITKGKDQFVEQGLAAVDTRSWVPVRLTAAYPPTLPVAR